MNMNLKPRKAAMGCIAAALLLSAAALHAQPFASPTNNSWDIIESGPRSGVAQMIFNPDFTITMDQIIVPNVAVSTPGSGSSSSTGRGSFSSSRDGVVSGGNTNSIPPHTNLFGFFSFPLSDFQIDGGTNGTLTVHAGVSAGQWGFDTAGRVVGFFVEVSGASSITTNAPNVNLARLTNAISFTGHVTTNAAGNNHLILVCSTPSGKVTFNGLPLIQVADVSGGWFGIEVAQGLPYNELFTVTGTSMNRYDVQGSGPQYEDYGLGYDFLGEMIVSRRNKVGFVSHHPVANSNTIEVRAIIGPINLKKATFSGRGLDSSDYAGTGPVTYRASRTSTNAPTGF